MRVVVDLTRCQGYGQCAFLAPGVFTMHGQEALMYDTDPGEEERERVLRAAAACPVQALHVDRMVTQHRTGKAELAPPALENGCREPPLPGWTWPPSGCALPMAGRSASTRC